MSETKIGKIQNASFGYGGYDDAMIGFSVTLESDKGGWGVSDFKGTWGMEPSENAEWTETDQIRKWGETVRFVRNLLRQAKKKDVADLIGTPVECRFNSCGQLESWRVLEEAI